MRDLPRITVRGHSVQGGSVPLRKAPLRSRVAPWSTKRICGPLAFRRATVGSRVRGKMWGCQEGDKKPGGCLGPLLSPPGDPGIPPPPGGGTPTPCHGEHSPSREGLSRLRRQAAGTAEPLTLCRGENLFLFSLLTGLCYCIIIIVQHNKKGLRLCSGSFVGIARSISRSWKS